MIAASLAGLQPRCEASSHVSRAAIIHLGGLSPGRSSTLPAAQTRRAASRCLFGLAGGGVCPAIAVTRDAVRSYRTFSPLPLTCGGRFASPACSRRAKPGPHVKGGMFSVALSLGSRRVAVSNHRALPSSDFPPGRANRPSDRLAHSIHNYFITCGGVLHPGGGNRSWRGCLQPRSAGLSAEGGSSASP